MTPARRRRRTRILVCGSCGGYLGDTHKCLGNALAADAQRPLTGQARADAIARARAAIRQPPVSATPAHPACTQPPLFDGQEG